MIAVSVVGSELLAIIGAVLCLVGIPHVFVKTRLPVNAISLERAKALLERTTDKWRRIVLPIQGDGITNWQRALTEHTIIDLEVDEIDFIVQALEVAVEEFRGNPMEMKALIGTDIEILKSLISKWHLIRL